ncbi:MAG: hypothetical protein ACOYJ6_14170 [Caulobacterales bacterium]|jgi:hypothetical protein
MRQTQACRIGRPLIPTAGAAIARAAFARGRHPARQADRLASARAVLRLVKLARLPSVTGLWLALLQRWLGLRTGAKPPTRFLRWLEQTERALAQAIRTAVIEDGAPIPKLPDAARLVWFARHHPCSDKIAALPLAARHHRGLATAPSSNSTAPADRQLPAGKHLTANDAGSKPAIHHVRALP